MTIHPTTIISPNASIGQNVTIGPFSIIGPQVRIDDNVELKSHVIIDGKTIIGSGTIIYPFASIGQSPQILKYEGEESEVIIGKNNTFREYVTIQRGTKSGGMLTKVGDNNLFMVGVHIAHDCIVGNNTVMANYASLGGHVIVGDYAVLGGLAAVQQFVRIGEGAMIGGLSGVARDVIPFGLAISERAYLEGLNLIGMERRGFNKSDCLQALEAFKNIFNNDDNFNNKISIAEKQFSGNIIVERIISFLKQNSTKSYCQPRKNYS